MRAFRIGILYHRACPGKFNRLGAWENTVAVFAVCRDTGFMDCSSTPETYLADDGAPAQVSRMRAPGYLPCGKSAAATASYGIFSSENACPCTVTEKTLRASITVEAAGVMAVVLFTIMVLIGQAMSWNARATGMFALHETVERERHLIEHAEESKISRQAEGNGWSLEITAPVFRPEKMLRMWSLAEDITG